ncbi:MAG: argininosuccinate lyase [Thermoplasmata archaeon]|nr:argininosuccinate lyase [Thermoplasmata archaeon]MCI4353987.1 argininosuccinate lyase [Thermoplasmata archaeon]
MLRDRFSLPLDPAAVRFSGSIAEDERILSHDLWGSLVHARMLGRTGIIPARSARRILVGLRAIARRAATGRFPLDPALEDVHLNVEADLTRRIGADGARLHTGRSRNDQVATDLALYERDALLALEHRVADLVGALLEAAVGPDGRIVVAGWTHLQPAQRVYWGQLLATHALRFVRDAEDLAAVRARLTDCPLGAGALAGSSLPLDRKFTAQQLGFVRPNPSSIDAVSDRDALLRTLSALAILATHISALSEELVIGAMPEVGRVTLSDAFVTTSSLMPHKRNPDLAELARAEAGPAIGRLVSALTVAKGLPIGYQRDLQRTKIDLFEGVERSLEVLEVVAGMVRGARFHEGAAPPDGATASVELVDALVRAGVPFRRAHGRVARWLSRGGKRSLAGAFPELRGYRPPTADQEPERRRTEGGSAWVEVRRLIAEVRGRQRRGVGSSRKEVERLARLRRRAGVYPPGFLVAATSRRALRAGTRALGRSARSPAAAR